MLETSYLSLIRVQSRYLIVSICSLKRNVLTEDLVLNGTTSLYCLSLVLFDYLEH